MDRITRSSAAKAVAPCSAVTESSHHGSSSATIDNVSDSSAVAPRSTRTLPTAATVREAESSKFVLAARRATRSSSSEKSSRKGCVIEILDDEMLPGDPKTRVLQFWPQRLGEIEKALAAPEDDQDSKPIVPSIIGQSGSYQILKICARVPQPPVPTRRSNALKQNKSVASDMRLGLSLECKEWMSKKLRDSFERGPTSYTNVKYVKPGSIAQHAGAVKDDILVWSKGPEPVIFHQLDPRSQTVVWQLIDETQLEEKNPSRQLKASGFFTFYVARPFTNEPPLASEPKPATRLSTTDVFLSDSIVTRARHFNYLTAEEKVKLLRDASDDAKNCFESDRNIVVESLPEKVKKSFYEVGFAEWGAIKPNTYQPILVLSPFCLSGASSVRRAWFENYENLRKNNKLSTMPHLVFWYGEVDPNSQFSMLQQRKFLSLNDAIERNCFGLPTIIQEKMRQKRKLTDIDKSRVRAQREMEADLQKKPDERILGRIPCYAEPHETIREIDLERLATKTGSGARTLIKSSKKRKLVDYENPERCALRSDRVSVPSLMTHAEATLAATYYGLSKRIELIIDEKAPPISEAEYQNLHAMVTVFCRVPLLDEFFLPHEQLHPETAEKYSEVVTRNTNLTHVCRRIRHRQYAHLRDVRVDIWRLFANSVNSYARSDCIEAKRFISVALHIREFFNVLWQEYMVPSDAPHPSQDRNGETEAAYKVLQNSCKRREIDREQRLSVVGELALNNDFTKKLSSHLLKFIRDGGVVDGVDNAPLFDKRCECSFGMKTAITGIRNFCGTLSRKSDEKPTVGSLFSRLRTCYAYDCFRQNSALGYSLRSRLDRLLWKLIAPLYEASCRGSSHSTIWGTVEAVLWARKPSQHQETYWPGLCLAVLASPSQKSRSEALIRRNELVLSSRIRSELLDTQRQIEKSLKFQSFYLVEFLESHTFRWVPEKDVITDFDGIFDPNKRKGSRMMSNIVTSPEYSRAFQKGVLVLGEQQHKASQLCSFTGDIMDVKGGSSFEKLAKAADVDRKRGCANVQENSSISWVEEANCLLASEGLLDYSTIRNDEKSSNHPPLHNPKQTGRELPPLDLQPSEKMLCSTVHVPPTPQDAGRQNYDDDLDVASIALKGVSCTAGKEACRSWFDVAGPPITNNGHQRIPNSSDVTPVHTIKVSPGVNSDVAGPSRSHARRKSSPALEPPLGSTAQVVSRSSFTEHSEGIQIHGRSSTTANQTNSRDGKRLSQPISPATDMGADLPTRESFIAHSAGDDAGRQHAFLALAREGQELHSTNVRLWKNYVQLKHDLAALEENHRKKVVAFKVLLDREKCGEDDKVEIAGSASTDPELKELNPPTRGESGVAFLMGFAQYIQEAVGQNAMLVTENDTLQEKISHLQVRHDKLNDLAQGLAGEFLESH